MACYHDRAMRRERQFRDRLDPLALNDTELMTKYCFPRQGLISQIREMEPLLQRRTRRSHAIPAHTQVLLARRIFARGSFQNVIGDTADKQKT
ncbi:putative nuclease HARBI1 [Portunus trituberculatus]|uniref:Putative nuclease HARBI1 n=1 Tax=Portunus trituberculatus TaxID=210409 RepID=A0A5B7I543_PORTR|nr:putative nuclease HARBI1 [Portunus trituberculatus]